MHILIAAIGRLKGEERALFARYQKRIGQTGGRVALGPLNVVELSESLAATPTLRLTDEAKQLAKVAAAAEFRIVLDERGSALTSAAFAQALAGRRDTGTRAVAFLIGGADGTEPALRSSAGLVLSLSALTLPHGLVRVMLAEQLYRASTILCGHPYHRE